MKPFGNTTDPKLVVVFSHPDTDEWQYQKYLASKNRVLLRSCLNGHFHDSCFTSIIKQVEYRDQLAPQYGVRKPNASELEQWMPLLKSEIQNFNNATIMPIGQDALKAFGFDGKITDYAGKELEWNGHRVIPNFDPAYVSKKSRLIPNFKRYIDQAFQKPEITSEEPEYKILDFKEAVYQIKRAYDLYRKGEIEYLTFDTETTAFEPWEGKLIMYSWSHTKDNCGYAFPLVVDNTIKVKPEKIIKFFDKDKELHERILKKMEAYETSYEVLKPIKREIMAEMPEDLKEQIKHQRKTAKQIIEQETNITLTQIKDDLKMDFDVSDPQASQFQILLGNILKDLPIVGHNLKFDSKWLHEHDIVSLDDIKILDDTMLMGYMVYNKQFGTNLKLQTLVNRYFGFKWKDEIKEYLDMYPQIADRHYGNVPTRILGEYAAKDAYWNMRLYERMKADLPDESNYITSIVNKANKIFSKIELNGLAVDWEMHDFLKSNYERVSNECLSEMLKLPVVQAYIKKHGDFNPNSSDQLRVLLYDKTFYELPVIKLKKFYTEKKKKVSNKSNKLSTDKNVIAFWMTVFEEMEGTKFQEKIDSKNPPKEYGYIADHIEKKTTQGTDGIMYSRWEECSQFLKQYKLYKRIAGKLLPTYINPVREMSPNGLYRPSYSLIATNTGRAGSGFHTMDQGSEITRMFTSRWHQSGGLILAPDYSQIEVRIVASLAGETALIEAYDKGYDIHATTAARTYKIPIEEVTHQQRQHAKVLNFFTIYGGGPEALADELKIPVEEARKILENFFAGYPALKKWSDLQKENLEKNHYILTAWGRKIPVPEIMSDNKGIKSHALRAATNYPVQSAASDCVLYSIVEIETEFRRQNLHSILIGSVHDSIEVDVYPGELFKVVKIFKEVCETKVQANHKWIRCPLAISFELGSSWGGAIEFDIENFTDNSIELVGSGLKRDFESIKNVAERTYSVSLHVIGSEGLSDDDFSPVHFCRDTEKWNARISLTG